MVYRLASRRQWTVWHPAVLVALVALGLMATWDAWTNIFQTINRDSESSHVWLVLPIALWLAWIRGGRLRRCSPHGLVFGLVMIAVGGIMYLIGGHQPIRLLWHSGGVIVIIGCFVSVLGRGSLFQFGPAFFILMFMVPLPGRFRQQVAIPLDQITARVAETGCDMLGIPVERLGTVLRIQTVSNVGASITHEESSNGMRMILSLTLVSYTIAFSSPLRNYVRMAMIFASPLLAIACNVIRLIAILWLYRYCPLNIAHRIHDVSNWLIPTAGFVLLLGAGRLLRWAMVPVSKFTLAYG